MEGIAIQDAVVRYPLDKKSHFTALDGVTMTWDKGSCVAVVGESGSGKSTMARLLLGLERPHSGSVVVDGEDAGNWSSRRWLRERRRIQGVFQDASGTLNPALSVYRNLEEGLRNLTDLDKVARRERILTLMTATGMSHDLLKVPTRRLSGGEQRRLSLLRALVVQPDYLVLDEVTSGLDLISKNAVLDVLEAYNSVYGCAYLFITHDRCSAYRIADRLLEVKQGKIYREGFKEPERIPLYEKIANF